MFKYRCGFQILFQTFKSSSNSLIRYGWCNNIMWLYISIWWLSFCLIIICCLVPDMPVETLNSSYDLSPGWFQLLQDVNSSSLVIWTVSWHCLFEAARQEALCFNTIFIHHSPEQIFWGGPDAIQSQRHSWSSNHCCSCSNTQQQVQDVFSAETNLWGVQTLIQFSRLLLAGQSISISLHNYKISCQHVLGLNEFDFWYHNINMIFSWDVAQLPPVFVSACTMKTIQFLVMYVKFNYGKIK